MKGPTLTEPERHVLEHATGARSRSPGYRNHYAAGSDHEMWQTLQGLVDRGLMRVSTDHRKLHTMHTFSATRTGFAAIGLVAPDEAP
jgi:hypothetical protein